MLGHPNCAAPCKKPFDSLMPVLVTDSSSGKLLSLVGTMGGSAQPQAVLQVLLNMVEHGLNPQEAIDKPRLRIGWGRKLHPDDPLAVEDDVDAELIECLKQRGHAFKQVVSASIDRTWATSTSSPGAGGGTPRRVDQMATGLEMAFSGAAQIKDVAVSPWLTERKPHTALAKGSITLSFLFIPQLV
ncbi:glutathione hydrolase-like YwrD proenzyme [Ixodes scapularis]|uniref:glutathione hydrolase-like YwrD proenzyme n=1 Tax=Ixodes scapularis TaxID=6945 RepID=UPI001A9F46BA|nr:glutathione hydrolase-like YwrD proenzyme [Ixodes scapularis]